LKIVMAVLRRRHVEVAHRGQAAGARHVLDDDIGVAGDVRRHMTRQAAGIDVVAAARREADHDGEDLALVEIIRARERGRRREPGQRERKQKDATEFCHRNSLGHAKRACTYVQQATGYVRPLATTRLAAATD
jgi:hypothetical protein